MSADPHGAVPAERAGVSPARARWAVIALHGRGGSARDIVQLVEALALAEIAVLAPQAAMNSWWPQSFLAPLEANEPFLTSALGAVHTAAQSLAAQNVPPERTVLLGFSQGACLALEFAARHARGWHLVAGLSGGLVGTGEAGGEPLATLYGQREKLFDYEPAHGGSTVFLGCHAQDPHIPLARVRRTEVVFEGLGAKVVSEIYPGAGHGVVAEEIAALRGLLNHPT